MLVLVYRLKEINVLNKANRPSSITSSDIQLSPIYVKLGKEYKFHDKFFCEKNKSIKSQTSAWQVTL